jgi:hypothetical protein
MSPVYRIDVNGVKAQILPARPGAARHGKPAAVEIPEIVLFRAGILNLWVTKTPAADGRALTSDRIRALLALEIAAADRSHAD